MKRTRKTRTRSPRVVAPRMRKPSVRKPSVEKTPVIDRATRQWEPVSRVTFSPRTMPLTDAELAGLEIPAFLKRELPATIAG